jgi:hypothetical protein
MSKIVSAKIKNVERHTRSNRRIALILLLAPPVPAGPLQAEFALWQASGVAAVEEVDRQEGA